MFLPSLISIVFFLPFRAFLLHIAFFSIVIGSSELSAAPDGNMSCTDDKALQEKRSLELLAIVSADQKDRLNWEGKSPEEYLKISKRDKQRRMRVGEIFGEGCFRKAADFASAALVYQHGNVPEHFFQTFLWAKRAVELGDQSQKRLMALGIDRYLVNIGQKQLFGSQASKPDLNPKSCYCLQQVEGSFPESLRQEYLGRSLKDQWLWLKDMNQGNTCPSQECPATLKASPAGSIPGFW